VRTLSKSTDGKLEKAGLIFQPKKDLTPPPIRIRIEEGSDWLQLRNDGTYQPIADPRKDRICHDIFHTFIRMPGSKTVNNIKGITQGYASDAEIRESLRTMEERGLLQLKIGSKGAFSYEMIRSRCPWCTP